MRHRKKTLKLGREIGPRRALLKNLMVAVILRRKVQTTLSKAKFIRPMVERAITRGKIPSPANVRLLVARLGSKEAVRKITQELGVRYRERAGGYTRITKLGRRKGDGAEIAIIELV